MWKFFTRKSMKNCQSQVYTCSLVHKSLSGPECMFLPNWSHGHTAALGACTCRPYSHFNGKLSRRLCHGSSCLPTCQSIVLRALNSFPDLVTKTLTLSYLAEHSIFSICTHCSVHQEVWVNLCLSSTQHKQYKKAKRCYINTWNKRKTKMQRKW